MKSNKCRTNCRFGNIQVNTHKEKLEEDNLEVEC